MGRGFSGTGSEAELLLIAARAAAGAHGRRRAHLSRCSYLTPAAGLRSGADAGIYVRGTFASGTMRRHAVADAGGVALSDASVTYTPLIAGEPTQLSLTFTALAAIALNETIDLVFDNSLFVPNYTLPKSVDGKYSWVPSNTTEQMLEDDSPDFSAWRGSRTGCCRGCGSGRRACWTRGPIPSD